jgi:hypothetical protein
MMITTATKIYLLTNVIFLFGISMYWFPEGLGIGLFAAPFAFTFSAPLIFLLAGVIWLLNWLKSSTVIRWVLFLAATALMTCLPFYWFDASILNSHELKFFIGCGFGSAFISILVLRKSIHRYFLPGEPIKTNVKREPWSG